VEDWSPMETVGGFSDGAISAGRAVEIEIGAGAAGGGVLGSTEVTQAVNRTRAEMDRFRISMFLW